MVKRSDIIKRCGVLGGGAGLGLYAVFGLLQGAAIGGAAGLGLARYLFGSGTLSLMANDLLPRMVVAASMLAGVFVSLTAFVVAGAVAGSLCGLVASVALGARKEYAVAEAAVYEED